MSLTVSYYILTAGSPAAYVLSTTTQTGDPEGTFIVSGYIGLTDVDGNPSITPTNTIFGGWGVANPPTSAAFQAGTEGTFGFENINLFAFFQGRIGRGTAGTCFSGGAGSGGTRGGGITSGTDNAGIDGGFGTVGNDYIDPNQNRNLAGAGNPAGTRDGTADGTGGVLILFVEGTITKEGVTPSTTKYFTANGIQGKQSDTFSTNDGLCKPFGGGTGGGIVIVVNNDTASLANNIQAAGGIIKTDGPNTARTNFQSGGNGAAVAYTFSEL
jgi:hypothetical protein